MHVPRGWQDSARCCPSGAQAALTATMGHGAGRPAPARESSGPERWPAASAHGSLVGTGHLPHPLKVQGLLRLVTGSCGRPRCGGPCPGFRCPSCAGGGHGAPGPARAHGRAACEPLSHRTPASPLPVGLGGEPPGLHSAGRGWKARSAGTDAARASGTHARALFVEKLKQWQGQSLKRKRFAPECPALFGAERDENREPGSVVGGFP